MCSSDLIGVKTHIYDLGGGLIEFMAIGTAVKKVAGVTTKSQSLPPQAILQDRDTFVDASDTKGTTYNLGSSSAASASKLQAGPLAIVFAVIGFFFYVILHFVR